MNPKEQYLKNHKVRIQMRAEELLAELSQRVVEVARMEPGLSPDSISLAWIVEKIATVEITLLNLVEMAGEEK